MSFKKDNKCDLSIGQFCTSKSGRDKNKLYIVYEIVDEDFVLLVNGKEKTISNPKRKNIKHLQRIKDIIENFDSQRNNLNDLDIKRLIKLKVQEEPNVK